VWHAFQPSVDLGLVKTTLLEVRPDSIRIWPAAVSPLRTTLTGRLDSLDAFGNLFLGQTTFLQSASQLIKRRRSPAC
jgi:hypothetical protein